MLQCYNRNLGLAVGLVARDQSVLVKLLEGKGTSDLHLGTFDEEGILRAYVLGDHDPDTGTGSFKEIVAPLEEEYRELVLAMMKRILLRLRRRKVHTIYGWWFGAPWQQEEFDRLGFSHFGGNGVFMFSVVVNSLFLEDASRVLMARLKKSDWDGIVRMESGDLVLDISKKGSIVTRVALKNQRPDIIIMAPPRELARILFGLVTAEEAERQGKIEILIRGTSKGALHLPPVLFPVKPFRIMDFW